MNPTRAYLWIYRPHRRNTADAEAGGAASKRRSRDEDRPPVTSTAMDTRIVVW